MSSPSDPAPRVVTAISASAPAECLWPQVFFYPHLLLPALAIIVVGLGVLLTILLLLKAGPLRCCPYGPYLVWVTFYSAPNYEFYSLN